MRPLTILETRSRMYCEYENVNESEYFDRRFDKRKNK